MRTVGLFVMCPLLGGMKEGHHPPVMLYGFVKRRAKSRSGIERRR